mmetsp:Transcript_66458/g.174222  ORF Transcript_66458/g.174222 Transcript_66458/m.174222 type:complete len:291 (-) Transcript_66458:505-1377(-)
MASGPSRLSRLWSPWACNRLTGRTFSDSPSTRQLRNRRPQRSLPAGPSTGVSCLAKCVMGWSTLFSSPSTKIWKASQLFSPIVIVYAQTPGDSNTIRCVRLQALHVPTMSYTVSCSSRTWPTLGHTGNHLIFGDVSVGLNNSSLLPQTVKCTFVPLLPNELTPQSCLGWLVPRTSTGRCRHCLAPSSSTSSLSEKSWCRCRPGPWAARFIARMAHDRAARPFGAPRSPMALLMLRSVTMVLEPSALPAITFRMTLSSTASSRAPPAALASRLSTMAAGTPASSKALLTTS